MTLTLSPFFAPVPRDKSRVGVMGVDRGALRSVVFLVGEEVAQLCALCGPIVFPGVKDVSNCSPGRPRGQGFLLRACGRTGFGFEGPDGVDGLDIGPVTAFRP